MAKRSERSDLRYFTTAEVAALFEVTIPTVVNWVKAGRMTAHKTAGGHRRIAREEIITFAEYNAYPLPSELFSSQTGRGRVLIIDPNYESGEMLRDYLVGKAKLEVGLATNSFSGGMQCAQLQPRVIVIDIRVQGLDPTLIPTQLASQNSGSKIVFIAMSDFIGASSEEALRASGFSEVIQKPFSLEKMCRTVLSYCTKSEIS